MILDGILRGISALATPGESQWRWWRNQGYTTGAQPTASGVEVNDKTALTLSAVFRAIGILAETTALLPLNLYRKEADDQRTRAATHPAQQLLNAPNPIMDGMTFRENMMAQLAGRGNAYAEKVWGVAGDGNWRPVMLWPIPSERVKPKLYTDRVEKYYEVTRPDGGQVILADDEMLHLRGKGDALEGWSPIRMGAESIGAGIAETRYVGAQMGKGNTPAGILHIGRKPNDDGIKAFKAEWNKDFQGAENVGKVGFLWGENATWINTSISNRDSQLIEQRAFTILEICRLFGVPPHLLYDLSRATFSNIEQQSLEYLAYTLAYWLAKWSTALDASLLLPNLYQADAQLYFEHLTAALVMTDLKTRFDTYAVARQWGIFSANDILKKENEPRRADGDDLILPSGTIRAKDLGKEPANAPPIKLEQRPESPAKPAESGAEVRRLWAAETMARMIRKETLELGRLAKDPKTFTARAEDFYRRHRATCREALAPLGLADVAPLVEQHCQAGFDDALRAAGNATPASLETEIASTATGWDARADGFARQAIP
jgi:HK97 family phage portal protein